MPDACTAARGASVGPTVSLADASVPVVSRFPPGGRGAASPAHSSPGPSPVEVQRGSAGRLAPPLVTASIPLTQKPFTIAWNSWGEISGGSGAANLLASTRSTRGARKEAASTPPERDARPIVHLLQSCLGGDHEIDAAEVREASRVTEVIGFGGLLPRAQLARRRGASPSPDRSAPSFFGNHRGVRRHHSRRPVGGAPTRDAPTAVPKEDERPGPPRRLEGTLRRSSIVVSCHPRRGDHRAVSSGPPFMPLGLPFGLRRGGSCAAGGAGCNGGEAATRSEASWRRSETAGRPRSRRSRRRRSR